MQQQGQAQSAQGIGAQEQLAAHRARMDSMLGLMNGVLAKGGPIGMGDIQNAVNQAHLSPTEAAQVAQDVNNTAGGNPNYDFTDWVKGHQASNLDAQKQIAARTPNMQFHNIGGRLVPVDMNGQTNPNPGSLITTLSPAEAAQIVKVDMGDGTTQQMPLSDAVTKLSTNPAMRILGPTTGGGAGGGGGGAGGAANNPLNMRFAGQEGATNAGGFAAFKTPEAGQAATDALFSKYADGGINTLSGLISRWAPPSENDTPGYIARVAKATGLDPNAPINLKDPAVARKIQQAMAVVEGNKNASVAPAPAPAASTAPPTPPAGPPGVQMGGAPPPPPEGAAGPYTGGGIGAALAPGGGGNPVVVRGTPLPAGKLSGDVGAIVQGMQLARANPFQQGSGAMTAGPGAPTGNALAGPSVELPPQPGWGSAVGTYSGGPGPAVTPRARPEAAPAPASAPVQPPPATSPPAPTIGRSAPLGTGERVTADIAAYTKNAGEVYVHQNNVNTLQNAYHALQLADTGPGTQNLQAARAFLQSFGIATSATGDQATQWAEAHKYLMDFARTQGGLGGTDLQAQLAQGSNASTDIPKPAALAVVRNNIAKERLQMAQVQEANGSNGYVEHTKNFAPSQDLRAYQADIMPPQELKQIEALQKTNPKAFEKFQKSLDIARAHGLISDEDLAAQNQRIRALGP